MKVSKKCNFNTFIFKDVDKVIESEVNQQLTNYIETYNILDEQQYGFRKNLVQRVPFSILSHIFSKTYR